MLVKNKAPIEEEVCAKDILNRMLEEEIKVIPKKLWMVVLKLCMVLKEILISKRAIASENSKELELEKEKINSRTVPINSLAVPEKRQELIEINNGEIVEVWTIIDPKD